MAEMTIAEKQTQGLAQTWSLMDFARIKGKMSVAPFTRKEDGSTFKSCIFRGPAGVCFVAFSSKLGELTPAEIVARKNELSVSQLAVSKSYVLHKTGVLGDFAGEESVNL